MNILPIEVLENILGRLSQKHAATVASIVCKKWNKAILQSSFYYSICILTEQQLKRFINVANEKIINNQPIGCYVQQLKLHRSININVNTLISIMKVFPNIHFINGLSYCTYNFDIVYPHLSQLAHFARWYKNDQRMNHLIYNKEIVKSLDININKDMFHFNPQSPPPIHFNLIGNERLRTNQNLPIQLLVLPTLINLVKLNISFYHFNTSFLFPRYESIDSFAINECTFESVHNSCPQLTILKISYIKMTISKEYHNQTFISAHQLKELHLHGTFTDPSCYTYFLNKYGHLDSFYIQLELQALINNSDNRSFQLAITRMLFGFSVLKIISITLSDEHSYGDLTKFKKHWPHDEFLMWLKQYSEQITHLEYPCDFIPNDDTGTELLQQPTFLTYLTSLSLCIDNAVHLLSTYNLQNVDHSIVISTFLKKLSVRQYNFNNVKKFYIYDFLTAFPNLESLQLYFIRFIYDEIGDMLHKDSRWECKKLHHIIQQRLFDTDSITSNNQNENDTYKLKHLKIVRCGIFFGYGLSCFLKKCRQLKKLNLQIIRYAISTGDTTSYFHYAPSSRTLLLQACSLGELCFDLSHLYFQHLFISNFYCTSWEIYDTEMQYLVNKLVINETLPGRESILNGDMYKQFTNRRCCLALKCKYIDELIFNK